MNLLMKDGVVYYPAEIHDTMGIKPIVKPIKMA
jgi:hypothetical protein